MLCNQLHKIVNPRMDKAFKWLDPVTFTFTVGAKQQQGAKDMRPIVRSRHPCRIRIIIGISRCFFSLLRSISSCECIVLYVSPLSKQPSNFVVFTKILALYEIDHNVIRLVHCT
jgi:hypothetical protein